MTARTFLDTNVLLYAGSHAAEDAEKKQIAIGLLKRADVGFSAQVMQEYYHVAYRKKRLGLSHAEALTALKALSARPVLPITPQLVIAAVTIAERHKLSYWDAAIVAAAKELHCELLGLEI